MRKTKWMLLPGLFLSAMLAAQTSSPVPAGTALMVRLDTTLATFSNRVGDPFQAKITQAVVINGSTLIPVGATVEGRVTKVTEPRRISGKPSIGILPEAVILSDRGALLPGCDTHRHEYPRHGREL